MSCPHHLFISVLHCIDTIKAILLGSSSCWWDHFLLWYMQPWLVSWRSAALLASCTHALILAFWITLGGVTDSLCFAADLLERQIWRWAILFSTFKSYVSHCSLYVRDACLQMQLCYLQYLRSWCMMLNVWYGVNGKPYFLCVELVQSTRVQGQLYKRTSFETVWHQVSCKVHKSYSGSQGGL